MMMSLKGLHPDDADAMAAVLETAADRARVDPRWIPDGDAPVCMLCGSVTFWPIGPASWRRHHCRRCGWVVCTKCCPKGQTMHLERWVSRKDTQSLPKANRPEVKRVCNKCIAIPCRTPAPLPPAQAHARRISAEIEHGSESSDDAEFEDLDEHLQEEEARASAAAKFMSDSSHASPVLRSNRSKEPPVSVRSMEDNDVQRTQARAVASLESSATRGSKSLPRTNRLGYGSPSVSVQSNVEPTLKDRDVQRTQAHVVASSESSATRGSKSLSRTNRLGYESPSVSVQSNVEPTLKDGDVQRTQAHTIDDPTTSVPRSAGTKNQKLTELVVKLICNHGDEVRLQLLPTTRLSQLLKALESITGPPPDPANPDHLIAKGTRLAAMATVADCNLTHGDKLFLVGDQRAPLQTSNSLRIDMTAGHDDGSSSAKEQNLESVHLAVKRRLAVQPNVPRKTSNSDNVVDAVKLTKHVTAERAQRGNMQAPSRRLGGNRLRVGGGAISAQHTDTSKLISMFKQLDAKRSGTLRMPKVLEAVQQLFPNANHRLALLYAYRSCNVDQNDVIDCPKFVELAECVVYLNNLWCQFETTDSDGARAIDERHFISLVETLALPFDLKRAKAEFLDLAAKNGVVTFDHFAIWCASRHTAQRGQVIPAQTRTLPSADLPAHLPPRPTPNVVSRTASLAPDVQRRVSMTREFTKLRAEMSQCHNKQ